MAATVFAVGDEVFGVGLGEDFATFAVVVFDFVVAVVVVAFLRAPEDIEGFADVVGAAVFFTLVPPVEWVWRLADSDADVDDLAAAVAVAFEAADEVFVVGWLPDFLTFVVVFDCVFGMSTSKPSYRSGRVTS